MFYSLTKNICLPASRVCKNEMSVILHRRNGISAIYLQLKTDHF